DACARSGASAGGSNPNAPLGRSAAGAVAWPAPRASPRRHRRSRDARHLRIGSFLRRGNPAPRPSVATTGIIRWVRRLLPPTDWAVGCEDDPVARGGQRPNFPHVVMAMGAALRPPTSLRPGAFTGIVLAIASLLN